MEFKLDKKDKRHIFIIAEISANHAQDFNTAVDLIKKAKECGADAVKFQAYTPDTMTLDAESRYFRIRHPKWASRTLYQLYKKAYTPWGWFKRLKKVSDDLGIIFFATVFDKSSVDLLERLKAPIYKISSFELTDLPLIEYTAKTKKPLILSGNGNGLGNKRGYKCSQTGRRKGYHHIKMHKWLSRKVARYEFKDNPGYAEIV